LGHLVSIDCHFEHTIKILVYSAYAIINTTLKALQCTKNKKIMQGFTIIEVLIVLAIAGLILLLVFFSRTFAQENSRNFARQHDTASIAAATSNLMSNNPGLLPEQVTE